MKSLTPIANGSNGRDRNGRFAHGNAGGPGNPYTKRVADLRTAVFDSISAEDLSAVVSAVMEKAKQGDLVAAKLVLSYIGSPDNMCLNVIQADTESSEALKQEILESIPREKIVEILKRAASR